MICRRAVEVVTESLDGPPPPRARIGLAVHVLFCSPCRRFQRQMARLHTTLETTAEAAPPGGDRLTDEARERIAAALNRASDPC